MRQWMMYQAARIFVKIQWYFLGDYYDRLAVQAMYLYRQSPLFKYRWQEMGLDFAESTFENDSIHFFHKAQKEHIVIRSRILLDSILKRPVQPYAMREGSIL